MRHDYRGATPDIANLEHGEWIEIERPADLTAAAFRQRVANAVNHFGRTRDRRFTIKTNRLTGAVTVRRIRTENELSGV